MSVMTRDACRVMDSAGTTAAPDLGAVVASQLERLMQLYATAPAAAERIRTVFKLLTAQSLAQAAGGPYAGLSFINADGLPFQWVQRLTHDGDEWGFLCEAGCPHTSGPQRLALTLQLIDACCAVAGYAAPRRLAEVAALLVPDDDSCWPAHWRSAAWVGVGIKGDRLLLKPYFNLNAGSARERWLKVGWLLQALGRNAALASLCQLSSACSVGFWPVALALDACTDGGIGRIKIYFRSESCTPAALTPWYAHAAVDGIAEKMRLLLDTLGMTGGERYPPGAFVVSLEIHADNSLSLKTDVAVTKWADSDEQVIDATAVYAARLGLPADDLQRRLAACAVTPVDQSCCAVARFVGLGAEPNGEFHINFYHAPALAVAREDSCAAVVGRHPRSRTAEHALRIGIEALCEARIGACWQDFRLPVGQSDQWVSAYVLARLREVADIVTLAPRHLAVIDAALDWLAAVRTPDGGWGYNSTTPNDADSTAWSILALRSWGRTVPAAASALLASCVSAAGVATYPQASSPKPAWATVCADVSALASQALAGDAIAGVTLSDPNTHALPRAYWWVSPLYVLAATPDCALKHDLLHAQRVALLRDFRAHGAFEMALLARLQRRFGLAYQSSLEQLIATQQAGGLWSRSARLRLVMNEAREPWRQIDSGPIYLDERGIFTSATALASLALAASSSCA